MIYLKYLILGERASTMNANLISLCDTVRILFLFFIGTLAQGFATNFAKGDYVFDWSHIQTIIMPAVIIVLNYVWKFAREITNPVIPFKDTIEPPTPISQPPYRHAYPVDIDNAPDPTIPKE